MWLTLGQLYRHPLSNYKQDFAIDEEGALDDEISLISSEQRRGWNKEKYGRTKVLASGGWHSEYVDSSISNQSLMDPSQLHVRELSNRLRCLQSRRRSRRCRRRHPLGFCIWSLRPPFPDLPEDVGWVDCYSSEPKLPCAGQERRIWSGAGTKRSSWECRRRERWCLWSYAVSFHLQLQTEERSLPCIVHSWEPIPLLGKRDRFCPNDSADFSQMERSVHRRQFAFSRVDKWGNGTRERDTERLLLVTLSQ